MGQWVASWTSASPLVEQEPEFACPVSQPDYWEGRLARTVARAIARASPGSLLPGRATLDPRSACELRWHAEAEKPAATRKRASADP